MHHHDFLSAWFGKAASKIAGWVGSPWAFTLAIGTVIAWALLGPKYHYSDTWQLIINTGTTVVTFLIVFLIQNTQNRDARAIHLKLDEIIHAIRSAHNDMMSIEKLTDAELDELAERYQRERIERASRKDQPSKAA